MARSSFCKISNGVVVEIGSVDSKHLEETLKNLGQDYKEVQKNVKVGWRIEGNKWIEPDYTEKIDTLKNSQRILDEWISEQSNKYLAGFSAGERLTWAKQIEEANKVLRGEPVVFIAKQAEISSKTLEEQAQAILDAEFELQRHGAVIRGIRSFGQKLIRENKSITIELLNSKLAEELNKL